MGLDGELGGDSDRLGSSEEFDKALPGLSSSMSRERCVAPSNDDGDRVMVQFRGWSEDLDCP
jgi:hypothetical protein